MFHLITHMDTHTLGRLPWTRDRPVAEAPTCTTDNIHVPGGIRTRNSSKRAASGVRVDRTATGIDRRVR